MQEETMKTCTKCGRELPLSEFSKDKSRKDGLQLWCKECRKKYYAEHREELLEHQKQYDAEHKEEKSEYNKQYYADNAERYAERYASIEGYAKAIRWTNLQKDRKYGRCGKNEDPLPSIEQYIELLQQRDYYDGKQYPFNEMGLDRIDNSKPHTIDNVVPCSTANNIRRGKKSFEEFCELINKQKEELELIL